MNSFLVCYPLFSLLAITLIWIFKTYHILTLGNLSFNNSHFLHQYCLVLLLLMVKLVNNIRLLIYINVIVFILISKILYQTNRFLYLLSKSTVSVVENGMFSVNLDPKVTRADPSYTPLFGSLAHTLNSF